jgi:hypothetical protein
MKKDLLEQYLYLVQHENFDEYLKETELILQEFSLADVMTFTKKFTLMENILKKYNVSLDKLKSEGAGLKDKVKSMFDKGMTPEQASDEVVKMLRSQISTSVKKLANDYPEMATSEKITLAIGTFFLVGTISGLVLTLLVSSVGQTKGMWILATITAPMLEEALKSYYIEKGMPWSGTAIFAAIEGVQYVIGMIVSGKSVAKALITRLATFLMHMTTVFVQKKIMDAESKDATEEEHSKRRFVAWVVGISIHSSWNLLAMIFEKDLTAWLDKK